MFTRSIDIDTNVIEPEKRQEAWAESLFESFGPMELIPRHGDTGIQASMQSFVRDDLRFNWMYYRGVNLRRSPLGVASMTEELYTLTCPRSGRLFVRHENYPRVLEPGHIYLFNHSVPYVAVPEDEYNTVSISMRGDELRQRVSSIGTFYALPLNAEDSHSGALLASFLQHFSSSAARWTAHELATLKEQLIDLVGLLMVQSASTVSSDTVVRIAHRTRALQYIESHLGEEGLTPSSVAYACGISLSYLHQMFRSGGKSVEATVVEERLKLSRRKLLDPAYARHSIASIGYECGFKDPGHFSRAFKRRYGATPGELRLYPCESNAGAVGK